MPFTIICSVGTSAAKGICSGPDLVEWVEQQGGVKTATDILFDKIKDVRPEGDALQNRLSAEVHSLVRIGVSSADRVLLLCSETPDGETCARVVKRYLERHFPGVLCEVEKIVGLQVHDAERFRQKGVVNFVDKCLNAVNNFTSEYTILNPTGGFKALVPYAVLVGMLKRVPCKYIFEQSPVLLTLPPLPIAIDRGPFERYRSVLESIQRNSAIPLNDWNGAIRHDDRELLEPLVEVGEDQVTLSGVGLLFLDDLRTPPALVPFLSRKAWEDCLDNLSRVKECDPFRYLEKIARDPASFQPHIDNKNGTYWMKPGNTTDRYLVSREGWKLLVWRAVTKAEYGDDYPSRVTVDLSTDRKRLGPFTRMEFAYEQC